MAGNLSVFTLGMPGVSLVSTLAGTAGHHRAILDTLPAEILHNICQYLPSTGVRKFRLVCRLFASVGLEHLSEGAYVHSRASSLNSLFILSISPLGKRLRSLFVSFDGLQHCHSQAEWVELKHKREVDDMYPFDEPDLTESQLKSQYRRYKKPFVPEHRLIKHQYHLLPLFWLFKHSPKLDTLVISLAKGIIPPLFAPTTFRRSLCAIADEKRPHLSIKEPADALFMATNAGIKLKQLVMGSLPLESIKADNPDLKMIQDAMSSLEVLVLSVRHTPSSPSVSDNGRYRYLIEDTTAITSHADTLQPHLSAFLSAAPNLRHLRFKLQKDPERHLRNCLLSTIFDVDVYGQLFPRLYSLSLENVRVKGTLLHGFLIHHRETLVEVRLENVSFVDPSHNMTWFSFFQGIRMKFKILRHFFIHDVCRDATGHDWDFGREVDGHFSQMTYAMDKHIRWGNRGLPFPFPKEAFLRHYVGDAQSYKGNKDTGRHKYIEDPPSETEWFSEDEEEFFFDLQDY